MGGSVSETCSENLAGMDHHHVYTQDTQEYQKYISILYYMNNGHGFKYSKK